MSKFFLLRLCGVISLCFVFVLVGAEAETSSRAAAVLDSMPRAKNIQHATVSPDGGHVAYVVSGELSVIPASGGQSQAISIESKLPVRDVARSRDWYVGVFDFMAELEFQENGRLVGVGLSHAGTAMGLALREDPERAAALAGFDTLCLAVGTRHDLDLLLARLDGRDVAHSDPATGRGGVAADVPDPDGHIVRIHTLT